jgi:hypothetical protein
METVEREVFLDKYVALKSKWQQSPSDPSDFPMEDQFLWWFDEFFTNFKLVSVSADEIEDEDDYDDLLFFFTDFLISLANVMDRYRKLNKIYKRR